MKIVMLKCQKNVKLNIVNIPHLFDSILIQLKPFLMDSAQLTCVKKTQILIYSPYMYRYSRRHILSPLIQSYFSLQLRFPSLDSILEVNIGLGEGVGTLLPP